MIASGLAASSNASTAPGGSGRASRTEAGSSDRFEQLMNPGAEGDSRSPAVARADATRPDRTEDAGKTSAPREGRSGPREVAADAAGDTGPTDRAPDEPAAEAALPDQLFAMIGGWREGAPAPGTAALAPATPGGNAGMPAALATALAGATADGLPAGLPAGGASTLAAANGLAGVSAVDGQAPAPATLIPGLAMPATAEAAAATAGPTGSLAVDFAQVLEQSGDGSATDLIPEFETGERTLPPAATTSPATGARPGAAVGQPPLAFPADPDAGFDDAFGARIGWLAEQRIGHAEIRLNPETLGTIDVRLQIDGTRVSAEFQSASADVRHALENSVGRLRELLGQHGLQLTHSDVGQGRGDGAGDGARGHAGATGGAGEGQTGDGRGERPPVQLRTRGLLDEYA